MSMQPSPVRDKVLVMTSSTLLAPDAAQSLTLAEVAQASPASIASERQELTSRTSRRRTDLRSSRQAAVDKRVRALCNR